MRTISGWTLLCGIVLAAPYCVAGEGDDAVALVDQAIKAHGGAEAAGQGAASNPHGRSAR